MSVPQLVRAFEPTPGTSAFRPYTTNAVGDTFNILLHVMHNTVFYKDYIFKRKGLKKRQIIPFLGSSFKVDRPGGGTGGQFQG